MEFMLGDANAAKNNSLLESYKNLNRNEEIVIVSPEAKEEFVVNMPIELAKRMQQVLHTNYQFYAGFDNFLTGKEMNSNQELEKGRGR